MRSVALGLLGAVLLLVYFAAVRTKWPLSYFTISDLTGYRVSRTPVRYVLFRMAPVVVVSFLIGSLAHQIGADPLLAVMTMAVIHVSLSTGRGLVSLLRQSHVFARHTQVLLHLAVATGSVASASLGLALAASDYLRRVVPPPGQVSGALWTAVFAAIGGAFILRATESKSVDVKAVLAETRAKLPPHLWTVAGEVASDVGADLALVHSVLATEAIQRPGWVRRIERIKGSIFPAGTYGVMQVWAQRPISDEESIRVAIRTRLANSSTRVSASGGIEGLLGEYNPSREFIDLAASFYWVLQEEEPSESLDWNEDDEFEAEEGSRLGGSFTAGVGGGLVVLAAAAIGWSVHRWLTGTSVTSDS